MAALVLRTCQSGPLRSGLGPKPYCRQAPSVAGKGLGNGPSEEVTWLKTGAEQAPAAYLRDTRAGRGQVSTTRKKDLGGCLTLRC